MEKTRWTAWISMQPLLINIFFSSQQSILFFPFTYLHSYDSSIRPSRIFQSCLSPATLSGSSLELPQRYLSSPASSGSTPGFSLCWLRLENLQKEALRRHPHSNPGSTSAGSLYSELSSDVKVPHSVLDSWKHPLSMVAAPFIHLDQHSRLVSRQNSWPRKV